MTKNKNKTNLMKHTKKENETNSLRLRMHNENVFTCDKGKEIFVFCMLDV